MHRMSIKNKEQISLHLKIFRNLSTYTLGRYYLRSSMYTVISNIKNYALPINIIQKKICQSQNQPYTQDNYYNSKVFSLKGGSNADIDQACVFRFDVEVPLDQDYAELQVRLDVQLVLCQYATSKIVGSYQGVMKGTISDAIVMDFYQGCPGQVIGSIHSCILNYQHIKPSKNTTKSEGYTQKDMNEQIDQILKYLQEKSQKNYKKVVQNLTAITGENYVQKKQSTKNQKINKQHIQNEKVQEQIFEKNEQTIQKRKRKPIFQSSSLPIGKKINGLRKSFKRPQYQKNLHQISMKIYQAWRQLNESLFAAQCDQFILSEHVTYSTKLKNKVGESIIRFKGLKDIDQYSDNEQLDHRLTMINHLRNQPKQLLTHCEFNILNTNYFTKERPIFFQESVIGNNQPNQHLDYKLLILVHGLGACRLDMEKMRVQLKRYYQEKVRILVSTSNQSRTQGDIEAMGVRLAAEIQNQVIKCKGLFKICMIGHSMGGLIIRSALPRLQKFKDKFDTLITFSSPHLGYTYSNSKLVDAGLWLINTMKKCISIQQMTMADKPNIQECFLYKLSQQKGLQWFKKITLLGSHQDLYVPFYSARIQKSKQIQTDFKNGNSRGILFCRMIDNILNRINGQLIRLDVNFCIQEQNFDNLIGRAAHISFINNIEMLRTFCIAEENSIF